MPRLSSSSSLSAAITRRWMYTRAGSADIWNAELDLGTRECYAKASLYSCSSIHCTRFFLDNISSPALVKHATTRATAPTSSLSSIPPRLCSDLHTLSRLPHPGLSPANQYTVAICRLAAAAAALPAQCVAAYRSLEALGFDMQGEPVHLLTTLPDQVVTGGHDPHRHLPRLKTNMNSAKSIVGRRGVLDQGPGGRVSPTDWSHVSQFKAQVKER
ncbi:hypothetical protein C8T65DRAFT_703764 [Cerioporus squamosus]|nr:hypothetical protein C8T65DRAFT_703764 [Cerioporus squamosus]